MALNLIQCCDPSESEEGGQAAGVAHEDVCVQAVTNHDCALRVNLKLAGHTLKHETAGLAHNEGFPLRSCLHCLDEAARP